MEKVVIIFSFQKYVIIFKPELKTLIQRNDLFDENCPFLSNK